jgi:hypothetical protein
MWRQVGSIAAEIEIRQVRPEYGLLTTSNDIRYSSRCDSIYRDPSQFVQKKSNWKESRSRALTYSFLLQKPFPLALCGKQNCRHKQYFDTAECIMHQVNKQFLPLQTHHDKELTFLLLFSPHPQSGSRTALSHREPNQDLVECISPLGAIAQGKLWPPE